MVRSHAQRSTMAYAVPPTQLTDDHHDFPFPVRPATPPDKAIRSSNAGISGQPGRALLPHDTSSLSHTTAPTEAGSCPLCGPRGEFRRHRMMSQQLTGTRAA
jgi:hypothetical protein